MENLLRGLTATVELIGDDWEVGDQFGASCCGSEAWKELAALLLELRIGIGDNPALKARVSCLASHDRRGARGRDPFASAGDGPPVRMSFEFAIVSKDAWPSKMS